MHILREKKGSWSLLLTSPSSAVQAPHLASLCLDVKIDGGVLGRAGKGHFHVKPLKLGVMAVWLNRMERSC